MIEALTLPDPVRMAGAGAGLLAAAGLLLVIPLVISQYRDVRRMRAWRLLEPERGDAAAPIVPADATGVPAPMAPPVPAAQGATVAASARAGAAPPEPVGAAEGQAGAPAAGPGAGLTAGPNLPGTVTGPEGAAAGAGEASSSTSTSSAAARVLTPAERVTADRPAVERITIDAPAIEPETGVHRVWSRVREPRHPLWIAAGTLLIGAGIFLAALQLLIDRPGETGRVVGDVVAEEVEVAVLNGTGVDGLADNVSDDVKANGYSLGSIGDSRRMLERTIVMFAEGQRLAARSVAQALGVGTNDIRPITKSIARGAGGADVVVVAGEDRVL